MDEQHREAAQGQQELTPEERRRKTALDNLAKARAAKSKKTAAKKSKRVRSTGAATRETRVEGEGTLQKHFTDRPWSPARVMDIPRRLLDPNYRYRFVTTAKPGNVRKKLQEGWEIDTTLQKVLDETLGLGAMAKTLDDPASSLDSTLRVRELIIMRMPVAMAEKRAQFYERQTVDPPRHAKKLLRREIDRESREMGEEDEYGEVYGGIKEKVSTRRVAGG